MTQEIKLLDVVALIEDIPDEGLRRGDVGTVVEVFDDGGAFEVEFCNHDGETINMVALDPAQLLRLRFDMETPEQFATAS